MKKKINNNKGVTLVELIIAVSISAILLFGAVSVFFAFYQNYFDIQVLNQQQILIDSIVEIVETEVRYSTEVIISDIDEASIGSYESHGCMYTENGILYRNGEVLLDVTNVGQDIEVIFYYKDEGANSVTGYTLYVDIALTSTTTFGGTSSENMVIKLLNLELLGTQIQCEDSDKGYAYIIYQ